MFKEVGSAGIPRSILPISDTRRDDQDKSMSILRVVDKATLSRARSSSKEFVPPTLRQLRDLMQSGTPPAESPVADKPVLSNAHTRQRAEKLLEKRKNGLREEVLVNTDEHMHSIFHGVPENVRPFNPKGVVFRHYFGSQEQKEKALQENSLVAGPVSYAQVYPGGIRRDYVDLVGVFLTKPEVKPGDVGVPGHNVYVDLVLPEDTPVLEIEPGRIYFIPGEPNSPQWIKDYYRQHKEGKEVPNWVLPTMKKIDDAGGLHEPTRVYFYEDKK
ncbi:MAG: hypothetical protein PHS17_17195 [Desulfobacterales bacterium]|nr:hypothetical protein [Desulfobacterales bacterium]